MFYFHCLNKKFYLINCFIKLVPQLEDMSLNFSFSTYL